MTGRGQGTRLVAVFASGEGAASARRALEARGLPVTAYSPVHGKAVDEGEGASPVRFFTLVGFLTGVGAGLGLCAYSALRWRFVVSGKPVLAWVPFVVIAFECSVLFGVLATFAGMLWCGRIPRFKRPPGYDARFSGDRFGLEVEAGEDAAGAEAALRDAGAEEIRVVAG